MIGRSDRAYNPGEKKVTRVGTSFKYRSHAAFTVLRYMPVSPKVYDLSERSIYVSDSSRNPCAYKESKLSGGYSYVVGLN